MYACMYLSLSLSIHIYIYIYIYIQSIARPVVEAEEEAARESGRSKPALGKGQMGSAANIYIYIYIYI